MINTKIIENLSVKEVEQLRALTDPLRLKLFNYLTEPRTVSEAAVIIGVERTSLYHHMQVLLKAELVEEVETRKVRHLTESLYKRIQNQVNFSQSHYKNPGPLEPYIQAIMAMSQEADEDCQRSLSRKTDVKAASRRIMLKFNHENIETIPKRITVLMNEFIEQVKKLEEKDGDIEYSVIVTHLEMP